MKSNLFSGRYWFHLHTSATDGELTVGDYFREALRQGVERLIFLEHIRREPLYDVEALIMEVKENAVTFGLKALVGFEAKLFPDGTLDIGERHLELADVVGLAEHNFPGDVAALWSALGQAVDTYQNLLQNRPLVWVHPGLTLARWGVFLEYEAEYWQMIKDLQSRGVKIELNRKYNLIPSHRVLEVPPGSLVMGIDAHRLEDLQD